MTGLVLTPRGDFEARVDMAGVLPDAAGDLAKLKIGYGGKRVELGELFAVSGAADHRLTIEGGEARARPRRRGAWLRRDRRQGRRRPRMSASA